MSAKGDGPKTPAPPWACRVTAEHECSDSLGLIAYGAAVANQLLSEAALETRRAALRRGLALRHYGLEEPFRKSPRETLLLLHLVATAVSAASD